MDSSDRGGFDRRTTLRAMALATVGVAADGASGAVPQPMADRSLEQAFRAAFDAPATATDLAARRLAFISDPALVIDSDVPFPLDRAGYADHLGFHASQWQRLELKFHDLQSAVHGTTGIVSAYYIQRGKPKDAGFRLRAGYCTAVCVQSADGWRAIALHFSALASQITDASPG